MFGAMSDSTRCGRSAPSSAHQVLEHLLSPEVALHELDAGEGVHRQDVRGDDAPLAACSSRAAYWLQAPGAAPRSTTACPASGAARSAAISSSLKTARERQPSARARFTNTSESCSCSQRRCSSKLGHVLYRQSCHIGECPDREAKEAPARPGPRALNPSCCIGDERPVAGRHCRARARAARSRADQGARPRRRPRRTRRHRSPSSQRRPASVLVQRIGNVGVFYRARKRQAAHRSAGRLKRSTSASAPSAAATNSTAETPCSSPKRLMSFAARAAAIIGDNTSSLTSGAAAVAAMSHGGPSRRASGLCTSAVANSSAHTRRRARFRSRTTCPPHGQRRDGRRARRRRRARRLRTLSTDSRPKGQDAAARRVMGA